MTLKNFITQIFIVLFVLAGPEKLAFSESLEPESLVWIPENGETLTFDVYRGNSRFGQHRVSFTVDGANLEVESDIELEVRFGPIRAFYYRHESEEIWQDGQLISLVGETRKDGDDLRLEASLTEGGMFVDGSGFEGLIALDIIPSSHWNIEQVSGTQFLSTETGEILPLTVTDLGFENIEAGGEVIRAQRYRLESDLTFDLWYDESGRWVKCAFEARGQTVNYVLRG